MREITVEIWHGELGLNPAESAYFSGFLDKAEQAHAEQLANQLVRRRFIETRARLRMILGHCLKQPPDSLHLAKAQHGKPYLPDFRELAFNLSHTGNYLALAVTQNGEIGLDIEQIRPRKNLTGLAEKCFASEEISYWKQQPENDRLSVFFRLWTAKEAMVKATGRGIGLGLNQCAVNVEAWNGFSAVPEHYRPASGWLLRGFDLADHVCGAVVIKSFEFQETEGVELTYRSLSTL